MLIRLTSCITCVLALLAVIRQPTAPAATASNLHVKKQSSGLIISCIFAGRWKSLFVVDTHTHKLSDCLCVNIAWASRQTPLPTRTLSLSSLYTRREI